MKALVTGGAGFIGSHLVDRLIAEGHTVAVVDNLSTGKKENLNPKAVFHEADITDSQAITRIFTKEKPAIVFHLAAIPRVPLSVADPVGTSRVNMLGTIQIFKAALDAKVQRLIFASSSSVYGDQTRFPLKEDMIPNPKSPYALQKLGGEQFARLFFELYGLPAVCLRYFNVYGPRCDAQSDYSLVIGKFLRLRAEGKPLTIYGDGEQTRAFCYVDDVVEATLRAALVDSITGGEVINVGSDRAYSINDVAKLVGGKTVYLPSRAGDVIHTLADITLVRGLLGWKPTVSFEEGVEKTKQWFEEILT